MPTGDVSEDLDSTDDIADVLDRIYHDWHVEIPGCIQRKLTAVLAGNQCSIWLPNEELEHLHLRQLQRDDAPCYILLVATDSREPALLLPYLRQLSGIRLQRCSALKRALKGITAKHFSLLTKGQLQLRAQESQKVPEELMTEDLAPGQLLPTMQVSIQVPGQQVPAYQQVRIYLVCLHDNSHALHALFRLTSC